MNSLVILQKQIAAQIENKIDVEVYFRELRHAKIKSDTITLIDQREFDGSRKCFIEPVFSKTKAISVEKFDELISMIKSGEIHSELSYDDFYNKFYNHN